jgi:hypothetical protein
MSAGPWACPACGRSFGRVNQSHVCAPVISADELFGRRPPADRAIHDAVVGHLRSLGPIVVEVVGVGVLLKRSRTFAELRPRRRGLRLGFMLSGPEDDPRISRTEPVSANRIAYFVDLVEPPTSTTRSVPG